MTTPNNAAALECVLDEMGAFIEQEESPNLDTLENWHQRLRATLSPPDALTSLPSGGTEAEDRFEQYVATLIDKNPDVRRLGERLAYWLDEDRFNTVNPILLGICERLATHPSADAPGVAVDELREIGELIRTQNNRLTDQPIFIVQQKRRICGVEDDFADGFLWYDARRCESYDEAGKTERDAEREADGSPPIEWQRGGYVDTWEFVTACFTEQGCKDYIARDGHNLREPRIYAEGSFRNQEWRTVRSYLAALAPKPEGKTHE